MFKWKKIIASASLTASMLPLVILSADPKNKGQISPQFSTFKEKAEKAVERALKEGIEGVLKHLQSLNTKLDNETDFKKKIAGKIYVEKLINFITVNKENIIKKPTDYGLPVTFPHIIATLQKYYIANIEYNNRQYKNVKVGKDAPLDYKEAIKPAGVINKAKDKDNKEIEEDNFIKNEDFEKIIKRFEDELKKQFNSIIFNEFDIPEFDKDITLKLEKLIQNGQEISALTVSVPKGFSSWEEYIKAKIKPRYVEFDLDQNEKSEEEENEQNKQNPNPADKPPLVPGDNPNIKYKSEIENITQLAPYVAHGYSDYDANRLKNTFDAINDDSKQNMFFFDNPINTRYLYKVESLEVNGGKVIATASITDKVDTSKKRRYKAEVLINNSSEYEAWLALYSAQIKTLEAKYLDLYQALGLDEKINYPMLRSDALANALFRTVDAAVKFYLKDDYKKSQQDTIRHYIKYWSKNDNQNVTNNSNSEFINYTLVELKASKINLNPYFLDLANAFESVYYQFETVLKANKEFITNNFKAIDQNFKLSTIDELFEKIKRDIFRLKSKASDNTFSIVQWFNEYVKEVKLIKDELNALTLLSTNKKITDNKEKEAFRNAYENAIKAIKAENKNKNLVKTIAGGILFALGLSSLIATMVMLIIKRKTIKTNKVLIYYVISIILEAVLLITGITLLALGMKGI